MLKDLKDDDSERKKPTIFEIFFEKKWRIKNSKSVLF
jgi:hypothetical protein